MNKKQLREMALKKRNALNPQDKVEKDEIIAKKCLEEIGDNKIIGIYISKENEVSTHDIINQCLQQGKVIVVPKVQGKKCIFVQIQSLEECQPSTFDVLEPSSDVAYPLEDINMMIVPLVAFDDKKQRIGYGKGYYDTVLDKMDCPFVGLAYALQQVENFQCDKTDVPLTKIITEYFEL